MSQLSPIDQTTGNRLVFEDSIEVQAPIDEVYNRWNDFPHFPQFMDNIEEVRPLGNNRYHWVARIFGVKQEWDAEVTENQPKQRISWKNINGAYNTGTVSFSDVAGGKTEVRLRLEYAPPGGKVGSALDKLTQTTKREVHEDMDNFKKLVMPGAGNQQLMTKVKPGIGNVLAPLAVPLAFSAAGGVTAYVVEKRLRKSRAYNAYTSQVSFPNAIAGWVFTGASLASIIGSATLRSQGRAADALFVGQWAPTFLQTGILARMLGHRGMQTNIATSVTSWTYVAATLGSIIASVTLHARGRREDGLFVGQWAPTFLGAALFTRLFNRLLAR